MCICRDCIIVKKSGLKFPTFVKLFKYLYGKRTQLSDGKNLIFLHHLASGIKIQALVETKYYTIRQDLIVCKI